MIRVLLCAVVALKIANARAAEPRQVRIDAPHFVGGAGCSSSSCHGGAGEKRSQYITWLRRDYHTRAFAILTNARSQRMAEALGPQPAETNSRCTVCHAPFAALKQSHPEWLAASVDPGEAVSCESCHGAAESWLRGHTRPDWSYATRIGAGMRDLRSLYVRANTCVACHQTLDPDIAAAGHPALLFELDSQSIAEPKHWRDPEGSGVAAWLTGQAVALRELSWQLATRSAGDPDALEQWQALTWLLANVTRAGGTVPGIESAAAQPAPHVFPRMQQQADALARKTSQQMPGAEIANRVTRELAASYSDFAETSGTPRALLFRRAQRLVLALERLYDSAHQIGIDGHRPPELAALRTDLRNAAEFVPAQFAARLRAYDESLGTSTN